MDKILRLFGLNRIKIDFPKSDQIFDIVEYLISRSDLFWKLPLVYHPPAPEKWKYQDLSKQGRAGMHFDGVESIEELDFVELEDQFSQDLFAEEWGAFTAVEEDDPE